MRKHNDIKLARLRMISPNASAQLRPSFCPTSVNLRSGNPGQPQRAAVGGFFTRHMLAVVCAGFAVPFVLIGLFMRRSTHRALAEAAELSRRGT
jgi:hypothetical protein